MRTLLHLITQPEDVLARETSARQQLLPDTRVDVVDLTQPNPDYDALVDKIFTANSVQVW